jgi:urease accessory protein
MPRATSVQPAAQRKGGTVIDTLILPYAQRQMKQGFVFGVKGICIEIDLAEGARLRTDDALVLDNGELVEIVAEAEPLLEVRTPDLAALARLAWHLGDRHVPVQILERRLRLARDPAMELLIQSLGAKIAMIDAPFEPEGGAYEAAQEHGHQDHLPGHGHHHHHDHHHHDDDHHHDHGHDSHKQDHGKG